MGAVIDQVLVSRIGSELNRNLVAGLRLRNSEANGAQFLIEMSIDDAILALDSYRSSGTDVRIAMAALDRAIAYRRQAPFTGDFGEVKRAPSVTKNIQRIVEAVK